MDTPNKAKPETVKLCPHCKQEVDPKASRCPHCHGKIYQWTIGKKILAGFGIFILLMIFIGSVSGGSSNSSTSSSATSASPSAPAGRVTIGNNGYLRISGSDKDVTVFTSQKALDDYTSAAVSKDTYGMAQIIYDGRGYFVPAGTKVLLIGYGGIGEGNVRILEGDHTGEAAWVPTDFISAQ